MEKVWKYIADFSKEFFPEIGMFLLKTLLIIALVVILIEILKAFKILDYINKILFYATKHLGISKNASLPLIVGVFAGLTYGAGAILSSYASGDMTKKDVYLVSSFLCICHAIIEDTILFSSQGAVWYVLLIVRVLFATLVTLFTRIIYEHVEKRKNNKKYMEEKKYANNQSV